MPSHEVLLHEIRQRIRYEEFFAEFLPSMRGRGTNRMALCPFHSNTDSPAFSVNIEEGLYYCMNPECGARGDFVAFYMRVRSIRFGEAVEELARRVGLNPEEPRARRTAYDHGHLLERNDLALAAYRPPDQGAVAPELEVDRAIVDAMHHRLMGQPSELGWLAERRGITRDTVVAWKLGHDGQRYYIPIMEGERCVNIRRYKSNARRAQDKMISWRPGFGSARLWPLTSVTQTLPTDTVVLLEGEMDTLLALQLGLHAMTSTGGAGTWRTEWNELFRGRTVVIAYDNDGAGHAGASKIARELLHVAASVRSITWPYADPPGFDFTDYIHGYGHTIADFQQLVSTTPLYRPPPEALAIQRVPEEEIPDRTLAEAARGEYHNLQLRVPVRVSGIASAPSLAPKQVQMHCGSHAGMHPGLCDECPLAPNQHGRETDPTHVAGLKEMTVEYHGNDVLDYVNVPNKIVLAHLKGKAGIPAKCGYVSERRRKSINVLEMQVIPDVGASDGLLGSDDYATRRAFQLVESEDRFMKANFAYLSTMVTAADPKTQGVVHVVDGAVPSQSDIDVFQMSEDARDRLRAFNPTDDTSVAGLWAHMHAIHEDLERVTRIYHRRDLMLAVDLTFLSPIGFYFQGERVVRGWMEMLCIGDSRTGKTTIVQRLLNYYRAGEFCSGDNTSFAGLVGGLNELQRSWFTRWGKIPLNDRRLVALDEAGSMPQEQIARMSSMRSSGVAEIVKIHAERTHARTRQIWVSNPRSPRPLSTFSQGVLAVKELIGAPEDIARFDLIVTAASGDVPLRTINAPREAAAPETFTSELCHQRVMWAWSRKPEQIHFTPSATQMTLDLATTMGEKYRYATEIPLVEPNEQRIKLARLAASVACAFFSTQDGETVQVMANHVEFAYQYLEQLYSKPSLAFDEYARTNSRRYDLTMTQPLLQILARNPNAARVLMEQEQLTQGDLMEIFSYDERADMREALTQLREAGFLRRVGSSFYVKTPGAIMWLRRELNGAGQLATASHMSREDALIAEHLAHRNGNHTGDGPEW